MSKNSVSVLAKNHSEAFDVPLVKVDTALESLRSSGHDASSAVGEATDNSLEANSNNIRIRLFTEKKATGRKSIQVVERVAIGDDGLGMSKEVLHQALSLGYSTRFNSRKGMGRFGVGAKLGAISQCKRIDIFTRQKSSEPWMWTFIDLEDIKGGKMTVIPEPRSAEIPPDCKELLAGDSGTLVIWSKCDRLQERDSGGSRSADSVTSELIDYISRTFRKFLDGGIKISVNGIEIRPHDPLYLMRTTRFHDGADPDPVAQVLVEESFPWPVPSDPIRESMVEVTMTLLPEKFRPEQGSGGREDAKKRRIDDNEGVSILRADREIYFGILRGVQPTVKELDRWIGIEIKFHPELDECFAVRNVKKGAEPVNGLRDKLKSIIYKTVITGRTRVQQNWRDLESKQMTESGFHNEAESIAAKSSLVSPKPRAGQNVTPEDMDRKIHEAAQTLTKNDPGRLDQVQDEIKRSPVKIVPIDLHGNELFEVEHLGNTALVKLNTRHPFYQKVYVRLFEVQSNEESNKEILAADNKLAKVAQTAIDLLICSYALAEGHDINPAERYSDLRTYWGVRLKNMVNEWKQEN